MPAQEKLRPRMDGSLEMQITISAELEAKLRKLKELYSHKNPAMSYAELLEILADKALQESEPKKSLPAPKVISKNPRYISINNRRAVYRRDRACTYRDLRTGRRCNSLHLLEIDHKIPVSLGGDSRLSNLRLLCRAHNQRAAEDLGILRTYRKSNASELLETHENLSGISTNSELGGSPQKFYGDNGSTDSL
jgi:5-methylcytosine-specific restriction endonuclease McrA